jgi:hypothetical protein
MRWKAILHQALWRWSGMTNEDVVGLVLNLRRAIGGRPFNRSDLTCLTL